MLVFYESSEHNCNQAGTQQGYLSLLDINISNINTACPGWARNSYKDSAPGNKGGVLVESVNYGALAQLASALPWHGRGHRFESDMLHHCNHYL